MKKKDRSFSRPYLMAMVLGTALAALGPPEISDQAITSISRYCTACWRNARLPPDLWSDCTQEVLCRLLERVPPTGWDQVLTGETEERREFLRAVDTVKKRRQRERLRSTAITEIVMDDRPTKEREEIENREVLEQAANMVLTNRQQRILQLSCEGHSVAEIAENLALAPDRISDEKYKAIQKLRNYFQTHGDCA